MKSITNITISTILLSSALIAEMQNIDRERQPSVKKVLDSFSRIDAKKVSTVDKLKAMFTKGKVTGQIRMMSGGYNYQEVGEINTHATAAGGMLKYELAEFNGFNAGVAFTTSHDLGFATGSKNEGKHNPELSSDKGSYTELTEAYINYKYDGLNVRLGRQILDTPLADSDDIRMIPNTFEAYVATYEINKFELIAGNVQSWQGVDTGLDDAWISTGDRGTSFGGVSYSNTLETSAWYYDISKEGVATNAIYLDLGVDYAFNDDLTLYASMQYLLENEVDNSGVDAEIYGVLLEGVAYGLGLNLAYNKSNGKAGKRSFSGIGGGTMYTSMDTMIIDEITEDRDAEAMVLGLIYTMNDWNFLYAYGSFVGDKTFGGTHDKAHIIEQDMGFEYSVNDEFTVAAIYAIQEDKENDIKGENDWSRAQLMVKYDF